LGFDEYPYDPRESVVKIEFTDAAGLRWIRTMGKPPERIMVRPVKYAGLKRWLPSERRRRKKVNAQFDSNPPF
jgi:hypothetical protein